MPIVEIEDLWYMYRASKDWVLRGIDFSVEEGEFVVVMGPSGCGKSTLCYTLNGIIPHLLGGDLKGKVIVDGMDTRKHSTAELSQRVGMVFQNPDTQLVALTVEDEVAFGPENLALPREEIRRRAEEALQLARLTEARKRSPHSLSGGEKQALVIASVLALRPKILVLDEPTSMLDPLGQKVVSDIVTRLNRELGMTVIAVDHRIEWAAEHADRILVMEDGQIVLEGTPKEVFSQRAKVEGIGFRPPQVTELAYRLEDRGAKIPDYPVTLDEGERMVRDLLSGGGV